MAVIGQLVAGRYLVARRLARGAVAEVYLAWEGGHPKALKLFPERFAYRAEREFACGRGLAHPHLNPIEARLELSGQPALLMPYLEGARLEQLLDVSPRAALLERALEVLAGLGALHARGWVHRDLKPENVIVSGNRAVLFDFDLSVPAGEAGQRVAAGTLAYLSPEQARGEPARPESDLYAFGVLLYRCLTGEVPFAGEAEAVLHAHREGRAAPPSALVPGLEPFDPVLERLLEKAPEARYPSAEAVARALAPLAPALGRAAERPQDGR